MFGWGQRSAAIPTSRKAGPATKDDCLTAWCSDAALDLALPRLARKVCVSWNLRMRTTAGRAWWPARAIELNPQLKEFGSDELWRTLKHELAHLVAYERSGGRRIDPHGEEWRSACADLGIAGEKVFHTLPFKGRRMKRSHTYVCPSCLTALHRVRPIRHRVACYECCRKFNQGVYHQRFQLVKQVPQRG